jgi:cytochrome c biogenesis protein CcdA
METLLGVFLMGLAIPFVIATLYFGSKKGDYYDSDKYKGNGTAH